MRYQIINRGWDKTLGWTRPGRQLLYSTVSSTASTNSGRNKTYLWHPYSSSFVHEQFPWTWFRGCADLFGYRPRQYQSLQGQESGRQLEYVCDPGAHKSIKKQTNNDKIESSQPTCNIHVLFLLITGSFLGLDFPVVLIFSDISFDGLYNNQQQENLMVRADNRETMTDCKGITLATSKRSTNL